MKPKKSLSIDNECLLRKPSYLKKKKILEKPFYECTSRRSLRPCKHQNHCQILTFVQTVLTLARKHNQQLLGLFKR